MQPELYSVIFLVGGFIVARAASAGVAALLNVAGRRAARLATSEDSLLTPRLVRVVRQLVFWVLLTASVVLALSLLGVGAIDRLVTVTVGLVPSILIALAIVVTGHLAGLLLAQLTERVVENLSPESGWPRLVHAVVVTIAIIMALQQLGVDISFLTQLLLIVLAIGGGGLMLAFALGARQHVANLLARRELEHFRVGDTIEVDGVSGTIVAIHDTTVEVATSGGTGLIPAARFATGIVKRSTGDDAHG